MSIPNNPLSPQSFKTFTFKHLVVAFKTTSAAESFNSDSSGALPGSGLGGGIVVVNEIDDSSFKITDYIHNYSYGKNLLTTTSASITVTDRSESYFKEFLEKRVAGKLGLSLNNVVFMIRTTFIGGSGETKITTTPFVGNLTSLDEFTGFTRNSYSIKLLGQYNSMGQLPNFSSIYQTTITHVSGNLHDAIPTPNPGNTGMIPREVENNLKNEPRKERIDKSKPMKKLKDIFDAFELDLKNLKKTNKRQLQEWLGSIFDSYEKKIKTPEQENPPNQQVDIDFQINLDEEYNDYKVDNRNLFFEQPEISQSTNGIRAFPIKNGEGICDIIKRIMKLSKKVGEDARKTPKEGFRVNICVKKLSDKYKVIIEIKKITIPLNSISEGDTGPGESAVNPMTFFLLKPGASDDVDIKFLSSNLNVRVGFDPLEEQVDEDEAKVALGNREPIQAERRVDLETFDTGFSGLRPTINYKEISALEYPDYAASIDDAHSPFRQLQTSGYIFTIAGNPYLYSDLCRKPSDVESKSPGSPKYYQRPEVLPLYAKLDVKYEPAKNNLKDPIKEKYVPFKTVYTGYRHINSITTRFMENGEFVQDISLSNSNGSM